MESSSVQSLQRAMSLLDILAERPGLPLGELSTIAGLHPATTRRLLATLAALGYIYQSSVSRRYYLGAQLMYLGHKAGAQFPFREAARPAMEQLSARSQENVYLAVLSGDEVLYIEVVVGTQSVRITTGVGDRCPAYSTATGRVLLASLPEQKLALYLQQTFPPRTRWTTTDPDVLREIITETRQAGVNITVDEEVEGLTSFASPVFGPDNAVVAALGVGMPSYRLTDELAAAISQEVFAHAQRVSANFCGRAAQDGAALSPESQAIALRRYRAVRESHQQADLATPLSRPPSP